MSTEVLIRGICSLIVSGSLIYGIYSKDDNERSPFDQNDKHQRYVPIVPAFVYPLFLLMLFLVSSTHYGVPTTIKRLLMICFDVFLHIGLYYTILLVSMPWIRKIISARVCAALWMIPNYLYFIHMGYMELEKPSIIFYTKINFIDTLVKVWVICFVVVMLWKIVGHLIFRFSVLRDSTPVTEQQILDVWKSELEYVGMKKRKYKLVKSPNVKTPLTIGFYQWSTKVVLPEKEYTNDELHLILKHEIVHIGRDDASTKFFMAFCTAVCWFNPLMWVAAKSSATDMELSCDETVLLDADEKTKENYARLVLETAGDDRGFSTCLSASAKSLRYRLKNIVQPRKRHLGALFAGIVFFLLIMTCGHVALAYFVGTGNELVFNNNQSEEYNIDFINKGDLYHLNYYDCLDEAKLFDYLTSLELYDMTGNYSYSQYDNLMRICYHHPDGNFVVSITDNTIKVTPLHGDKLHSKIYLSREPIDWKYLDSLVVMEEKEEINLPDPPEMAMYFSEEVNPNGQLMIASGRVLSKKIGSEEETFDESKEAISPNLISGFDVRKVKLYFSHQPYIGEYLVEIRKWNEDEIKHGSSLDFEDENVLVLEPYSAHYTVYGLFTYDGSVVYEMEYKFDVELPE